MNAPVPLEVPTPEGSGQAVHPDVVYCHDGFLGYKYWMACTPYPFAADRAENPVVRVSNDGHQWQPFADCPDPLVEAPADPECHHADTDITIHDGVLHVVFITTRRENPATAFSVVTSTDGRVWSEPSTIHEGAWAVSPSLLVGEDGHWHMWHILHDGLASPKRTALRHSTGSSISSLLDTGECSLEIPGHVIWHIDVILTDEGLEALVAAFRQGADPSRCRLFHAASDDGLRFVLSSRVPLIEPTRAGWDNRMIYRSTFVKHSNGLYQLWYSAASWGLRCGIGYLEGRLASLQPLASSSRMSGQTGRRVREDAGGLFKYLLSRCMPPNVYRRLALLGKAFSARGAGLG